MIFNFKMMIPSTAPIPHEYAKEELLWRASKELTEKIMERLDPSVNSEIERGFNVFEVCFDTASLDEKPNADEPIKHGEWIPKLVPTGVSAFGIDEMTAEVEECSICHKLYSVEDEKRYCPFCGAKMDGERKENEQTN